MRFLSLLLMIALPGVARAEVEYFPLYSEAQWTYGGSPMEIARSLTMSGPAGSGEDTHVWDGPFGRQVVRLTDGGQLVQVIGDSTRLLLDFGTSPGETWTIDVGWDDLLSGSAVSVTSVDGAKDVAFGSFEQVIHFELDPPSNLADAGVTDLWFAPKVGLIAFEEITIAGPQTYELAALAVADAPAPVPVPLPEPVIPAEEFVHRGELEREGVLYSIATTSGTVKQDGVVFLDYTVIGLDGERTYHFNSTQQVEFSLSDAEGNVVWVWSELLGFGDALTQFTLGVGDTVRSVESLSPIRARLSSGDYTLTGFLPTDPFVGETVSREDTEVSIPIVIVADPVRGLLSGTAIDQDGSPVSGAAVSAHVLGLDSLGGIAVPSIASFTDRDGRFRVGRVSPGTYRVTSSKRGYSSASRTVEVVAGETLDVTLKMVASDDDGFENAHSVSNDRLVIEVATDRSHCDVGDTIRIRYRATNITEDPLPMQFPSGQRFDLMVTGTTGVLWTWSATRSFIQVVTDTVLGVGEQYVFETAKVIPSTWAGQGRGLGLEAYLALANFAEEGGLSRGLTRGYVKFGLNTRPVPDPRASVKPLMVLDRSVYVPGDTIDVRYSLTNVTEDSVRLAFNSGQRYDLALIDGDSGEYLWTWSMTRLFDLSAAVIAIAPGESYEFSERIDLAEMGVGEDGVMVLEAYLTAADAGSDVRSEDTRTSRRLWVGARPPAEEPPLDPGGRVGRSIDVDVTGDSLLVTYVVHNGGGEDIRTVFPTGQGYDIVLTGMDFEWSWSEGKSFTTAVREEVLASGDSIVVRERVPLPVLSGRIDVVAFLNVMDADGGGLLQEETSVHHRLYVGMGEGGSDDATAMRSDFDSSGSVDFSDFISFAVAFGTRSGDFSFDSAFDLDEDGQVGFSDFLSFASAFGASVSTR